MQIIILKQLNKSSSNPLRPMPVSVLYKGSRGPGETQRKCSGGDSVQAFLAR